MAKLTTLKDRSNNTIYPLTKTNAVTDSNGTSLDSLLTIINSNKAGKTETNIFTETNTFSGTLVATALTNLTKDGSISGGIVDSIEDAYVSSSGEYFRIKWKSGFQMAGSWSSISETSSKTITHGLTFTGTGYVVLVSNSSGKTSGNTEGVVTGRPTNGSQILVSAGYLDPNTTNFEWLVCGFSCE